MKDQLEREKEIKTVKCFFLNLNVQLSCDD